MRHFQNAVIVLGVVFLGTVTLVSSPPKQQPVCVAGSIAAVLTCKRDEWSWRIVLFVRPEPPAAWP